MDGQAFFQDLLNEFKDDLDFQVEGTVLDITEQICVIMNEQKINRAELSRLLNIKKPAVTKMLNGSTNFTLKRLIKIAIVLNRGLNVQFTEPKKAINFNSIKNTPSVLPQKQQYPVAFWDDIPEPQHQEQEKPVVDKAA